MKNRVKNRGQGYIRILSSAEAFGYGPCSKLTSIVKRLRNEIPASKIDFLGEDSALSFALQNHYLFNTVREYDGIYPNANEFDLVLSVMNPYTILWGWFHNKKCIYIDSLHWFWKFERNAFGKLESTIDQLRNANSLDEVWALVKDVTGHNLHYVAHRLSTISCIQYFNTTGTVVDIFRKKITNAVEVNPIIDVSHRKKVKRDTILISLGGLLSPFNREKEASSYVNLVLKVTENFISEASKHYRVIIATSPEITRTTQGTVVDVTVMRLSQEEMLETINRSALVLTPAGITTMYECLMYETPFFILPELHDGHYPNYLRLAAGNKDKIKILASVFPNALINPLVDNSQDANPNKEIVKIQSLIKKLNITNNKTFRTMNSNVNSLLPLIQNPKSLRKMAKKQMRFFGDKMNENADVVEVIKKGIEDDKPPIVRRKHTVGIISSAIAVKDQKKIGLFTRLGTSLAKHNINIATGAAVGISHVIGKSAKDAGSKLIGFSPTTNALTHSRQSDNAPINHFDIIHFNGDGFTARSLKFINTVDALIMVSGRTGTLSEFTIAFEEGIPIFVLKGYGGISDHIEEIISYANKERPIPLAIFTDADELSRKLLGFLQSNYYK
jgi:uncharacterized protein (TIGR00725 family)